MAVVKTVFLGTFILVFFYIALILLLCFPIPQRMIVYCNWLQFPLYPRFSMPEYYGFGHHQVRNMQITTEDNITLGAWHILPYDYYRQGIRYQDKFDGYDDVLADPQYPTFVYFHGNAMSRTAMWRVEFYKSLTSRFGKANIIVIDYRGFGDSEGVPSEEGLKKDARATLNWLLERKVPHHHISLIGHSLGTGVATTLAYEMTKAGDPLHALILEAAYSSLPNLLFEYRFLETIPILGPLHHFSWIKELLLERLFHTFDSLSLIHDIDCPVLIIYGVSDFEIPGSHSHQLFHRMVYNNNSSIPFTLQWLEKDQRLKVDIIPNEATVYYHLKGESGIRLVILNHANHNNVGYFSYAYEAIGDITDW